MSEKVVVTREIDMRRGGAKGNMAAPVITVYAQNKSGGALVRGDVVVWDKTSNSTADSIAFTTTTSQNNADVFGMVFDASIANSGYGRVQVWGPTDALKVDGTTDIAIGDYIGTFTTAKIGSKTTAAGAFARALEAYATNDSAGVIDAFINCLGSTIPSASVATLADAATLTFGTGSDVTIQWDGTDLEVGAAADDSVINFGNGTLSFDIKIFGNTTDTFALWDASADTLQLQDATKLGFGNVSTAPDVTINWDGTDLEVAAAADDSAINFGNGTASFDVKVFGNTTDLFALWDASASILQLQDATKLGFGNVSTAPDVTINWDGTDLEITAAAADSVINIGGAAQFDVKIFGNTTDDFILWDGSGNTLEFSDGEKLGFGNVSTAPDVTINWDGTDLEIAAAADDSVINFGDGTTSFDIKVFGNTSDLFALWDASASILQLQDATKLGFGNVSTAPDVSIVWDGTDLEIAAAADDAVINFGTGTNSFDIKLFGNDTNHYVLWDASDDDLLLMDGTSVKFGTGADVEIRWDGTDLDILAVGDDLVINFGNGTNSFDVKQFGNTAADYVLWDASANNLDLLGAADIRIANIGTLDFAAQGAGTATFTITGLTSNDLVVISPREATQGAIVVDKVESAKVTIRNTASESANVELNYYVLAKAS